MSTFNGRQRAEALVAAVLLVAGTTYLYQIWTIHPPQRAHHAPTTTG